MIVYGCGKQHKAEALVNDFVKQNTTVSDCTVEFAPIDSTDRITPERMSALKKLAVSDPVFKRGAALGALPKSGKYIYTRAKIINGTDTAIRTFYLDPALTRVVAFKQN